MNGMRCIGMAFLISMVSWASPPQGGEGQGIRYQRAKDINFEELLIQGQVRKPEITVVTGDTGQGNDGLLRLRTNFMDRIAEDFGEAIP